MTGGQAPDLGSVQRPMLVPSARLGTTISIVCEALGVGKIALSIDIVDDSDGVSLERHLIAVPAPDPFAGTGLTPELAAERVVLLMIAALVRESWLHPAPDWEMCAVIRERARRMAVASASGSSIR